MLFSTNTPSNKSLLSASDFHPAASAFDAETVKGMGIAYDRALRELRDRGQPPVVREVLARRIIDAAKAGERDSKTLCEIAISVACACERRRCAGCRR